jgi:hypothetical protein
MRKECWDKQLTPRGGQVEQIWRENEILDTVIVVVVQSFLPLHFL